MTDRIVTAEDFFKGPGTRSGLTAWLRQLEEMVPTRVPEQFGRHQDVAQRVRANARTIGIRVRTRTIDGEVWVLRLAREEK